MRHALVGGIAAALALVSVLGHGLDAQQGSIAFTAYAVKERKFQNGQPDPAEVDRKIAQALGKGWQSQRNPPSLEYRISPGSEATLPRTWGDAWAGVHRLHAAGLFDRIEPVLSAAPPPATAPTEWVGDCTAGYPSKGVNNEPGGDGALSDPTWSLDKMGANVFKAWEVAPPGTGVVIGHPDTGYLLHPSISGALLGRGFNFTDGVSDALDTADEGKLQWAGHGTRTSSVIAGRRFQVSDRWISGVAPEARVMPLKVAHRVVLLDRVDFDMDNVALAIRAAAIGDTNFVRAKADVISMSLGGTPSRAVQEALAIAEARNVIVLAAAGNQVPRREVVFPARYKNVIAVAASNFDRRNWAGSSKGGAVAVAAPGQNVWTAKVRHVEDKTHYCLEPSSGTSYAVATTAGVAALWLAHHRQALEQRPDLDRAKTFKALAFCTADPISVADPQKYGGGILNARTLMDEPLPSREGPTPGQSVRCAEVFREVPPRTLTMSQGDRCENLAALAAVVGDEQKASALLFDDGRGDVCARSAYLADEVASLFASDEATTVAVHEFLEGTARDGIVRLRRALLDRSISPQLRRQLLRGGLDLTE